MRLKQFFLYLGIPLVLILSYFAYKKRFVKADEEQQEKATGITEADLENICNQLESAMGGMGTDEDLIFSLLENRTAKDLIRIYNRFGLRSYGTFTGTSATFTGVEMNLFEWLKHELSKGDYLKIKSIFAKTHLTL